MTARPRVWMLLPALLAAGCPTRPKFDRPPTIEIKEPRANTYWNASVTIRVRLLPEVDVPVSLFLDGAETPFATVYGPLYTTTFDTTGHPQKSYSLVAEATFADETVRSAPVTFTVDRTPPTATLRAPTAGAADVALRAPIVVDFSEPIAPTSFAASLEGPDAIATTVVLASDARSVTITPKDLTSIALPATLTLTLGAGIVDPAGNALTSITPWSWTAPDWIGLQAVRSNYPPGLTLGPDGRPVVVFASPGSIGVHSVAAAKHDGVAWVYFFAASDQGVPAEYGYSVVTDRVGNPIVVWSDYAGDGSRSLLFKRWDGTYWTEPFPPVDAVAGTNTNAGQPSLRLDRNDNPVVSWLESGNIFVARWTGTTWDKGFGQVGVGTSVPTSHELVLDANDARSSVGTRGVEVGVSTWAGGWSPSEGLFATHRPSIATNAAEQPVMAVEHRNDLQDRSAGRSGVVGRGLAAASRFWRSES